MLLEARGQRILIDTGAGATLEKNAAALGVDLSRLDAVFLSHGHYDHTGGLEALLKMNRHSSLPVYGHPDIFDEKYSLREGQEPRYIGIPRRRAELEALGADFKLSRGPQSPCEGISTTGEIPRVAAEKPPGPSFLLKKGNRFTEDLLRDDQAMVIESSAGLIVMLGCAHAGLVETLGHILFLKERGRICAVLGGTHLLHTPEKQLGSIIARLERFSLEMIAPCHCTGIGATCALRRAFGERCLEHRAGSVFEFPL
ncbi:MAG: MBL fold metallo-hydrolase [Dethiobacteria bacterium]|jgi:7,8-dihydropterin-6-yl-methyl-4-(beta-D-ribofuranosyl)aminobenzene 5'-phosphate synthase